MMTKASRNKRAVGLLALALSLTAATQLHAACAQSDLAGTWFTYGISGDTYYGSLDETDYCKVRLNSAGTVVATGSSCIWRDDSGTGTINIAGGALKVNASCNVTGSIRICLGSTCDTMRLQFGKLARDKNTFSFVGYAASDPDVVVFHEAVKQ